MDKNLKRKLEYHYKKFDVSQIYPDPLIFPRRFSNEMDIELSAFISSIFAYGNVIQIINSLERIHTIMGNSPTEFILNFDTNKHKVFFKDIKHRFYSGKDILQLFLLLQYVLTEYESLKHLFLPIRATWSSERSDLMFDGEQAYRFVKRITDAGGAITFSTTTDNDGTTMEDEETVLKYVDAQLSSGANPTEYIRPVGAYLVGE